MINSIRVANRFCALLPAHEPPEHTEGYEGFYHLIESLGTVEYSKLNYIVRDHDAEKFEERNKFLKNIEKTIMKNTVKIQ